ncbi:hypothetical protein EYC84_005992 [Monilinia fructicola]|uniref:Uncharacterized protein n=1 Tax=Monilinia fructicola TaxID=38448 RepID=A0A5M9K0V5_MONFR|nr:hypothetical protein EYC84_005992 [Monilinia fructicola]
MTKIMNGAIFFPSIFTARETCLNNFFMMSRRMDREGNTGSLNRNTDCFVYEIFVLPYSQHTFDFFELLALSSFRAPPTNFMIYDHFSFFLSW